MLTELVRHLPNLTLGTEAPRVIQVASFILEHTMSLEQSACNSAVPSGEDHERLQIDV